MLVVYWLQLSLIIKIGEVENRISEVSGLVKETVYDAKISDIERKYLTTSDNNKFTSDTLYANIKQKELANKSNISNLLKNFDLNAKVRALATRAEL